MEKVEGARAHALLLYGVIVGLCIRDALSGTLPNILAPGAAGPTGTVFPVFPETLRLVAFLTMVVRFYMGAAAYAAKCKDHEYKLDLFFGILHFILFYAWSISIPLQGSSGHWFRDILMVILGYNMLWWLVRHRVVGRPIYMVRLWTLVNALTALMIFSLFSLLRSLNWTTNDAEGVVLILLIVISWIDLSEIIQYSDHSKGLFSRIFAAILDRDILDRDILDRDKRDESDPNHKMNPGDVE